MESWINENVNKLIKIIFGTIFAFIVISFSSWDVLWFMGINEWGAIDRLLILVSYSFGVLLLWVEPWD